MIFPVLLLALTGAAIYKAKKPKKLSPDQLKIFRAALGEEPGTQGINDVDALRRLARAFRAEGFRDQADILDKRADTKSLPPELKEAYREVYQKALNSTNHDAVIKAANEFKKKGMTGSADKLYSYAATLTVDTTDNFSDPTIK